MQDATAAVLMILIGCAATAGEKVPANFLHGRNSLQGLIEFPDDMPEVQILIRCAGHALKSGTLRGLHCEIPDLDKKLLKEAEAYERAVIRAQRRIRLSPALVDGKPTRVWFSFSVVVVRSGQHISVEAFPNHLWDLSRYGPDYVGAQPFGRFPWPLACRGNNFLLWISMHVDAQGNVSNTNIETGSAPRRACEDGIVSAVENTKYIPAVHNGQSVSSIHIELFVGVLRPVVRF